MRPTRAIADPSSGNAQVANRLREAAQLLHAQGASAYRVNAYRRAADSVARMRSDVRRIFEAEGVRGLDDIPGVGLGIASAIAEMLATGSWSQLERLRGEADPAALLQSVPGIGRGLARRIHDELHIDSLEALESAAQDGRLERMQHFGARRAASVRASLDAMLRRAGGWRRPGEPPDDEPSVDVLLDIDREYRERATSGRLRLIAPKRFNPSNEAWLPILRTRRGAWHFTALFSNTALAHRLGRTHDWVVIYFLDGDHVERQRTVVTETHGPTAGRRVVRGREDE